ncbi:MAG: RNase adapter RapZ [Proteobacteria bacterium]|nr:RNase adapter RapZ [Pseudomonadota bacterium]MBU1641185.1 RNase adapter RapZ [Pseudomonadota bacterium]
MSASSEPQTVLLTGLSGAGKTTALNAFEDMGYYCIDNLPYFLVEELVARREGISHLNRLALVMDSRDPLFFERLPGIMKALGEVGANFNVFFLTADDATLVRRYSQMRRVHHLASDRSLPEAISDERSRFKGLLPSAAREIDTSHLSPHQLRGILRKACGADLAAEPLPVTICSFGFKHGLPTEADLVWDVRFLPNPYFQTHLKEKTGKEGDVADFVLNNEIGQRFLSHLEPLLTFLVPQYQQAGKVSLTIAIGCTGGKHRSVAVSQRVAEMLSGLALDLRLIHRDIGKE